MQHLCVKIEELVSCTCDEHMIVHNHINKVREGPYIEVAIGMLLAIRSLWLTSLYMGSKVLT